MSHVTSLRRSSSRILKLRPNFPVPKYCLHTTSKIMSSTAPSNFGDQEQKKEDPKAGEQTSAHRADAEKKIGRNPHPDFAKVQASRPEWAESSQWHFTKTRDPEWKLGKGANDGGESLKKNHIDIDPYEEGRPAVFNYKLLISAIVPRPIGFVSTRSEDGEYQICPALITLLTGPKTF